MPLEENPYIVPQLNALIIGQKLWSRQRRGSTLRLLNALLKISILLHEWAKGPFSLATSVGEDPNIYLEGRLIQYLLM